MKRPLGVLCVLVSACTSSAPTQEAAKTDRVEEARQEEIRKREEEAKKVEAELAKQAEEAKKAAELAEAEAKKAAEEAAKLAAAQLEPTGETPVFVMLGGTGSRTAKPVANAVLAHSWGWGSASAADIKRTRI